MEEALRSVDHTVQSSRSAAKCSFCDNSSKYACPRCGAPYCSLTCYRCGRHEACSERFYRQCVVDSLRTEQHDPNVRRRMEETLAREAELQAEADDMPDSDDSDSASELAERLSGVDLEDADAVWSRLTESERHDFRRQTEAGTIVCDHWQPWWTVRVSRSKVVELDCEPETPAPAHGVPSLLTHVPPFATLTRTPPSPLVVNSLISVLYTYAYLRLLYDGDWSGSALEVSGGVCLLSGCLAGEVLDTGKAAVEAVEFRACGTRWQAEAPLRRQARAAVHQLLIGLGAGDGPDVWYVLAALSDLWRLVALARAEVRAGRQQVPPEPAASATFRQTFVSAADPTPVDAAGLRRMLKKLEYLFSWGQSHGDIISEKAGGPGVEKQIVIPT